MGIREAFDDDPEEARQALLAMETELRSLVLHCVAALRERGLSLPFFDPDLVEDA